MLLFVKVSMDANGRLFPRTCTLHEDFVGYLINGSGQGNTSFLTSTQGHAIFTDFSLVSCWQDLLNEGCDVMFIIYGSVIF